MSGAPDLAVVAVVAAARNGVIGFRGAMPWHIPSDLRRYRSLTMGRPMIMGRRTLDSIGRVLDGRDTVVMTRAGAVPYGGAIVAESVEDALAKAVEAARRRGANEIVIAGGAQVYRQFLPVTTRVAMTVVDAEPEGDTFFPALAEHGFARLASEEVPRAAGDSAACRFELWERSAVR